MKIPAPFVLLALAFATFSPVQVRAQAPAAAAEAAAQVEVTGVKFNSARFGGDVWLESEIDLMAKPGGRAGPGFVDRVRVTLSLGLEASDEKGAKRLVFYRANAEMIALEGGTKSTVRFFLPPEVVRRDRLRNDVKYYAVEIEAGGQPQTPTKPSVSSDFTSAEMVRNFLSKVTSESGQNEGILVPQHLSPFANDSQRRAPSVFRREAQR
jgi:hypothetical protein